MTNPTERLSEQAAGQSIRPIGPLCRLSTSERVNRLTTVTS